MSGENRAFRQMYEAALARLSGRVPEEIAARTGLSYEAETHTFHIVSLGASYTLSWPDCTLSPEMDAWQTLVLLHYMDGGDGTPLSGRTLSFSELRDGLARGGGFDRQSEQEIALRLSRLPEERLRRACLDLGARFFEGKADLCAEFAFLPRYVLTLRLWFADEELDGGGRLQVDASADHYLGIEDAVTVGSLVLEGLLRAC